MPNASTDKLAVLIDADNAQASIAAAGRNRQIRHRHGQARLRRLDHAQPWRLEGHAARPGHPADPAVPLHRRQERHRLGPDHRRDGPAARRPGGRLLPGVLGQRFHPLATRIRESGRSVYGFGERKTPKPFVAACDRFIYTEILRPPAGGGAPHAEEKPLRQLLADAVDATSRDDGWSMLAAVGAQVMKANPSFDARNYGFRKLGDLVKAQDWLEIKQVPFGDGSPNAHILVRMGRNRLTVRRIRLGFSRTPASRNPPCPRRIRAGPVLGHVLHAVPGAMPSSGRPSASR
jgi:hypothetical protein